ncbi:class I SAM-dependent methyltransferase [Paenibacillus tarimensis]
MIVSTSFDPSQAVIDKARTVSARLGANYVPRRNYSLSQLTRAAGDDKLLVVSGHDLRYYDGQEPPLYFHPSMAFVRVKRLRKGESDPLLDVSGCRPGDHVLDCTAGLAADAFVFSYAVGDSGRVTALESEPLIALIVGEGLKRYETGIADADAALRRIEMRCEDHWKTLSELPDKSYDIVYFDPMFRRPIEESSSLQPLRTAANRRELAQASIAEAIRVARKSVVMKEHKGSPEFGRLGFERRHVNTSKIAYGVIQV